MSANVGSVLAVVLPFLSCACASPPPSPPPSEASADRAPQLPEGSPLRSVAADAVRDQLPVPAGARLIREPHNPRGATFYVEAAYCFDGGTPEVALTRVAEALSSAGWRDVVTEPTAPRLGVSASRHPLLLNGFAERAAWPDCAAADGRVYVELAVRSLK